MTYEDYKRYFSKFKTKKGYYKACEILAFKSEWVGFKKYKQLIEKSIDQIKNKKIIGADICCGEYAWLPRHFYNHFSKIYCVDFNSKVFRDPIFYKKNCYLINKDASKEDIFVDDFLDYIYCGYNMYYRFIKHFYKYLKHEGIMFLMKPKNGDDFLLRKILKKYDLTKRYKEIKDITKFLKNKGRIIYSELEFKWIFFNPDMDKILAALSVVSLGDKDLLNKEKYNIAIKILFDKLIKNKLILSQRFSIWIFRK